MALPKDGEAAQPFSACVHRRSTMGILWDEVRRLSARFVGIREKKQVGDSRVWRTKPSDLKPPVTAQLLHAPDPERRRQIKAKAADLEQRLRFGPIAARDRAEKAILLWLPGLARWRR